jgi:hypothetical protein
MPIPDIQAGFTRLKRRGLGCWGLRSSRFFSFRPRDSPQHTALTAEVHKHAVRPPAYSLLFYSASIPCKQSRDWPSTSSRAKDSRPFLYRTLINVPLPCMPGTYHAYSLRDERRSSRGPNDAGLELGDLKDHTTYRTVPRVCINSESSAIILAEDLATYPARYIA